MTASRKPTIREKKIDMGMDSEKKKKKRTDKSCSAIDIENQNQKEEIRKRWIYKVQTNAILDIFRWRQAQLKRNESFKVGQPFSKK